MIMSILFMNLVWFHHNTLIQLLSLTKIAIQTNHPITVKGLIVLYKLFLILYLFLNASIDYMIMFIRTKPSREFIELKQKIISSWSSAAYVLMSDHATNFMFSSHVCIKSTLLSLLLTKLEFKRILDRSSYSKGLEIIRTLRCKLNSINDILGNLLFAYYLSAVSGYCRLPDVLEGDHLDNHPFSTGNYLISTATTWILAAYYHRSITTTILNWANQAIFQNETLHLNVRKKCIRNDEVLFSKSIATEDFEQKVDKLNVIRNEVFVEPLALSCFMFTVTFNLVGSVSCGLV